MSKFSGLMFFRNIRCDDDDDGMLCVCLVTNKIFYDFYSVFMMMIGVERQLGLRY